MARADHRRLSLRWPVRRGRGPTRTDVPDLRTLSLTL